MENVGAAKYVIQKLPDVKRIAGINQDYTWEQHSWRDFEKSMKVLVPDAMITPPRMPKLIAG